MKRVLRGIPTTSVVFLAVFFFLCSWPGVKQAAAEDKFYDNKEVKFTIKYPSDWVDDKLQTNEVLRVHKPNAWKIPVLAVSIVDLTEGAKLEQAAEAWIASVKEANPGSKRFKAVSTEMIKLEDGTPAASYLIKWTWSDGMTKLFSVAVTAYKGEKSVTATATNVLGGETPPDVLMKMCQTLKFY